MEDLVGLAVNLGGTLVVLVGTYLVGSWVESRHFRDILRREAELRAFPAVTFRRTPPGWSLTSGALCTGSVVISLDYFKRFLAGLRSVVGGSVSSYETLLDRARREAILRLKDDARQRGFDAVLNVRLESSRIASSGNKGKGTAGVEILAFGTGVAWAKENASSLPLAPDLVAAGVLSGRSEDHGSGGG